MINHLIFHFQGELIRPSRQNGILISNYSLVLQNVRLNDAGYYSCQAENYIGATESNKLELKIKCKFFDHKEPSSHLRNNFDVNIRQQIFIEALHNRPSGF